MLSLPEALNVLLTVQTSSAKSTADSRPVLMPTVDDGSATSSRPQSNAINATVALSASGTRRKSNVEPSSRVTGAANV